MRRGGTGGASTQTGLTFEADTDLASAIARMPDYSVVKNRVFLADREVGLLCGKQQLYTLLFKPRGIEPREIVSKLLLPDEALLSHSQQTVHILEKKFQSVRGSVDEKLQTCDFKIRQYRRLLDAIDLRTTYSYVLNDWFRKPEYRDTLDYIRSKGARYFFNEVPLAELGI